MFQTEGMIYIVGPLRLQNELIASCLERETRAKCLVGEDICHVRFPDEPKCNGQPNLVLWDCQEIDTRSLLAGLRCCGVQKSSQDFVVLFNVCHGLDIEKICVGKGVRGFFYGHDSLPLFLKGIQAILKGQLWISRQIMSRCILENKDQDNPSKTDSIILSPREAEILAYLAVGATNEGIAKRHCISAHTVKTHLYNIYKKINVPNRLQAALWAAKNL